MPTVRRARDVRPLSRWLCRDEIESGPPDNAERLEAQLERRRAAALRLPPLECGCRDPLHPQHRAGLCRSAPRRQS
jgi:hypothetical protein